MSTIPKKLTMGKLDPHLDIVAGQIFKTLVVSLNGDNKSFAVCVLPVNCHLDFKKVSYVTIP